MNTIWGIIYCSFILKRGSSASSDQIWLTVAWQHEQTTHQLSTHLKYCSILIGAQKYVTSPFSSWVPPTSHQQHKPVQKSLVWNKQETTLFLYTAISRENLIIWQLITTGLFHFPFLSVTLFFACSYQYLLSNSKSTTIKKKVHQHQYKR